MVKEMHVFLSFAKLLNTPLTFKIQIWSKYFFISSKIIYNFDTIWNVIMNFISQIDFKCILK